jgi:hypothetical protein
MGDLSGSGTCENELIQIQQYKMINPNFGLSMIFVILGKGNQRDLWEVNLLQTNSLAERILKS